jgi:ribosomal protein S26
MSNVDHPKHYNEHPSGIECIEIIRHMNFNLGNVIKYVWRADLKNNAIEDLEKAMFYLQDEITKRQHQNRFLISIADLKSTEKNND